MSKNLPDAKTMGMGSGWKRFLDIAGQNVRSASQENTQPAARPRRGPSAVTGSIRSIANQEVRMPGTRNAPAKRERYKGAGDEEEKFVEKAKKRFKEASEAETDLRRDALQDFKFRSGDQWDQGDVNRRQSQGRPCLTINQMPQFTREVTNEQRQNRTAIKVNPVDDGADVDTAEVIEGLMRHIEYISGAEAAYDTAYQHAVTGGFGYWFVTTEYVDEMSFDLEIKIKRERNPFAIYIDPFAVEADRSDMRWAFRVERWSKEKFEEEYPDSKLSGQSAQWDSIGGGSDGWIDKDSCQVVSYWYKETEEKVICQLSDGSVILKETLEDAFPGVKVEEGASINLPDFGEIQITNMRKTQIDVVRWAKINGVEVLEETEWPGKYIPVVPVLGDEMIIDGKLSLEGVIRYAKDPQRQYNYMASATAEAIGLAPKAPFVAAEGQIEGYEEIYRRANIDSFAVLPYKPVSLGGSLLPAPQRQSFEPAIQATTAAMLQAAQDMRATTGIDKEALGQASNAQSGVAIRARAQQSQGSNYHYADNLTRAIRYTGMIILDLVPKVYDAARVVRIIGEDGTHKVVNIGPKTMEAVKNIYDLSVGRYDITVSTGPSFQTRRQEAVSGLTGLAQSWPKVMDVAGDFVVKSMDVPYSQEIGDRIARTIPPQVKGDDSMEDLPPEVQQKMQQQQAQLQQAEQAIGTLQQDLKQQLSVKKMELDSKERIEAGKQRIEEEKLDIERAKVQSDLLISQAKIDAVRADRNAQQTYEWMSRRDGERHDAAFATMQHEQGMERAQQGAAMVSPMQDGGTDDGAGEIAAQ